MILRNCPQGGPMTLRTGSQTRSAIAVTPVSRDRLLPRARPCTASCSSFEGQHPPRTWPLPREEQAHQLGYAPSEHPLKPWPTRPHQEIDALFFRDIRIGFNSPLASAALITGDHVSPRVTTESTRVVRHGAPNGPAGYDIRGDPCDHADGRVASSQSSAPSAGLREMRGRDALSSSCARYRRSRVANGLRGPLVVEVRQVVKEAVAATEVLSDLGGELFVHGLGGFLRGRSLEGCRVHE
jgi:hypothetical protein